METSHMETSRMETSIGRDIRIAEEKAKADTYAKNILSNRRILGWILKECVEEFSEVPVEDIAYKYIEGDPIISKIPIVQGETNVPPKITGLNTENAVPGEGKVTFDLLFSAKAPTDGSEIKLIINVEAQNRSDMKYALQTRGMFYCARLLSAQLEREFSESHYEDLKKVYSIWISTNPKLYQRNTINLYQVRERNIVGRAREPRATYDLLTIVMINLGKDSENKNSGGGILRLLSVLFSSSMDIEKKRDILEREYEIPMTQKLKEEVLNMGGIAQGYWDQGHEAGLAEGHEAGLAEGRAVGAAESEENTTLANVRQIMAKLGMSADQAMNLLDVSEGLRKKIERRLSQ